MIRYHGLVETFGPTKIIAKNVTETENCVFILTFSLHIKLTIGLRMRNKIRVKKEEK